MSVSVVTAFVCAVLAAIGTGVLVGRCIRAPRTDIIVWACATTCLAIALGAQALGLESGYGSGTFRAVQITAQLIAPLWLAWGLVELTGRGVTVRFGAKLVTAALTFVSVVVLVTDPLSSDAFGKTWPTAAAHYQVIPKSLLNVVAAVTVLTVVIALAVAGGRAAQDLAWRPLVIPGAAAGAGAVALLGLRLTLPDEAYAVLCAAAAVLAWLAGLRADQIDLVALREVDAAGEAGPGERDRDEGAFADDDWYRPAAGYSGGQDYPRNGQFAGNGEYEGSREYPGGEGYLPAAGYLPNGTIPPETGIRPDGGDEMNGHNDRGFGRDPGEQLPADRSYRAAGHEPAERQGAEDNYGLIAIYTLADDRAAEFDALAEQVVAEVQASEPDTLVYAVHTVPNAPMQRIFYEVYRDKQAYEGHRRQAYIQRFEVERTPYVLATNLIELGMQQAKLSAPPGLSPLFGRSPSR